MIGFLLRPKRMAAAYNELKKQITSYQDMVAKLENDTSLLNNIIIQYKDQLKHDTRVLAIELEDKNTQVSILCEQKRSLESDLLICNTYLKDYRAKIVGLHEQYVKEYTDTNWMPKSKYEEIEQDLKLKTNELKWLKTKLDNLEKIPDLCKSPKELLIMRDSLYADYLVRDKQGTPASDQMARELVAKINTIDWIVGKTDINGKRVGNAHEEEQVVNT